MTCIGSTVQVEREKKHARPTFEYIYIYIYIYAIIIN